MLRTTNMHPIHFETWGDVFASVKIGGPGPESFIRRVKKATFGDEVAKQLVAAFQVGADFDSYFEKIWEEHS